MSSKRFTQCLFVLVAVFLVACSAVLAADAIPAEVTPSPSALSAFLQQTLLPLASAFAMALFSLAAKRLNQRWKLQALSDQNSFLYKLAGQGIALAEERAAKLAGSVSSLTGDQKLNIAVDHMLSFFPKLSQTQAQDIVHSVLAMIPGAGATGEVITLLPGDGGYSIPAPPMDQPAAGAQEA